MPRSARQDVSFRIAGSIGFLMHKVHQAAIRDLRRRLEPLGLTERQFGLLAILVEEDGQRQATLCERGSVDPNTMVGLLNRLQAAGLVRRCRDERDRRVYVIRITPAGRRLFRRCLPRHDQAVQHCWGRLSADERRRLRDLLRKLLGESASVNTSPRDARRSASGALRRPSAAAEAYATGAAGTRKGSDGGKQPE